jgi:hypothetical protein
MRTCVECMDNPSRSGVEIDSSKCSVSSPFISGASKFVVAGRSEHLVLSDKDVLCALWQEPQPALPVPSHPAALVNSLAAAAEHRPAAVRHAPAEPTAPLQVGAARYLSKAVPISHVIFSKQHVADKYFRLRHKALPTMVRAMSVIFSSTPLPHPRRANPYASTPRALFPPSFIFTYLCFAHTHTASSPVPKFCSTSVPKIM